MAVDKNKISAEATRLVQKGQLDKAIRCYERILAHDPADVRVLLKVGELQQKKGDARAAAATFERCAETYAEQGFLLKSVAVYKQILKLAPEDRVSERLAALYQQLGLVSEAMGQLQLVAAGAERAGEEARLLDVLRRVVELDPENVVSSVKLGETYARLGEHKLATEHLARAADRLKRNSRIDEYVKVAERIAALVPDDWGLARELASIQLARGDAKRALARLHPCFKADPKNVETLTLLGQAFQDLGQTSKLVSVYRELGRIHAEAHRAEDARGAWRHVLELVPEDPEAVEALGGGAAEPVPTAAEVTSATAAWGVKASTAAATVDAPTSAPEGAAAPPGQGEAAAPPAPSSAAPAGVDAARILVETDVYLKYGLHEKALEHLQKLLADQPDHLDARDKASRIRELRNDVAGAAAEALRVARAALEQGLEQRARAAFERARSLAPDHPDLAALASSLQVVPPSGDTASEEFVLEIDDTALADATPEVAGTAAATGPAEDELALRAAAPVSEEVVADEGPTPPASRAAEAVEAAPAPCEPAAAGVEIEPEEVVPGPLEAGPRAPEAAAPAVDAGTPPAPPLPERLAADLEEIDFFIAQGLLDEARDLLAHLAAAHPGSPAVSDRARALDAVATRPPPARSVAAAEPAAGADYLYSVRDVLEPFKKGVEQALGVEDAETHYDLGIAYREMGLLDDAIQEFEKALRGGAAPKRLDALAMIGLCRTERGDLRGAIAAYRDALRIEGVAAEQRRAVEYQLAAAYEAAGERDAALHFLHRAVGADPDYRDARAAIERLGGGPGRPPPQDTAPALDAEPDGGAGTGSSTTGTPARSA